MRRRGFTLIELLVVIAIIAILAAILFPVFAKAREKARTSSCQSNLKQISVAFQQYTQDYDEKHPYGYTWNGPGASWVTVLNPYLKSQQVFVCPSDTATANGQQLVPFPCSYGANENICRSDQAGSVGLALAALPNPAGTVLVTDTGTRPVIGADPTTWAICTGGAMPFVLASPTCRFPDWWAAPSPRHMGLTNVMFADAHVKAMKVDAFYQGGPAAGGGVNTNWMNPAVGGP
jgi:prepilin-type N-terminal cleavage/methylation domain-containing protein/prepilin-type processing-associated H-X9-DG protein